MGWNVWKNGKMNQLSQYRCQKAFLKLTTGNSCEIINISPIQDDVGMNGQYIVFFLKKTYIKKQN
jgi:hypothetical protein